MSRVRIHNPLPGTTPFTSTRNAAGFVRRGLAFMYDDVLHFHRPTPGFYQRLQDAEFERSVAEGRGDRVYWNGSAGHHKMLSPGKARS
jgi:hypothetical protein